MSYPRDLDDYSDSELVSELERRKKSRANGRCDYCHQPASDRPCGQPRRHKEAA